MAVSPKTTWYTQAQLNSTTAPSGASLIGIADAGSYYTGTTVEAALQEVGVTIGALGSTYLPLAGGTLTGALAITPSSALTGANTALSLTATLNSGGAVSTAAKFTITTAGSDIYRQTGFHLILNSGYTGGAETDGIRVENLAAGTGTNAVSSTSGNLGAWYQSGATTTGSNVGLQGQALGGNQNFGLIGKAFTGKINATNGGVIGLGLNDGGGTAKQFGGYFGLQATEPTFVSAGLIADNGATTSNIFVARDNGTIVFTIADNGGTAVNGFTFTGSIATANTIFATSGSDTNIGLTISTKGTADVTFTDAIRIQGALAAVSASAIHIDVVSPGNARILCTGNDVNTPGTYTFAVCSSDATEYSNVLTLTGPVANGTNLFTALASVSGTAPTLSVTGGDTNIPFRILPKGASALLVGSTTTVGTWTSAYATIQVGQYATILGQHSGSSAGFEYNLYFDGSNYRYLNTLAASEMAFGGGVFWIRTAPSGTAGNVATLTTRLAIDNVGNQVLTPVISTASDVTAAWALTKTFPSTPASNVLGMDVTFTGAGSHSQLIVGFNLNLAAGYTGAGSCRVFSGTQSSAGTGADGLAFSTANANYYGIFSTTGTTAAGHNVGIFGQAFNALINYGMVGKSGQAGASKTNIGVVGIARNSGASGIEVAGFFGLLAAQPTFTSAALMCDNGSTTSDIFVVRDNGTATMTIVDGGAVTISTGAVSTPLTVTATAVSTRLNVDNTNATPNSGFGIKLGGVATWSIAAIAANFAWYNDVDARYAFSILRDATCQMTIGNSVTALGQLGIYVATAATKGLVVRGFTAQSANLQEWQNVSGTALATMDKDGNFAAANVLSGVYTPTRSAEANLDANVTVFESQYSRVGNTVTVSGRFTADPTLTATATSFELTLPIASNIGAVEDLAGTGFCGTVAGMGCAIEGSVANNTAVFTWVSNDITSKSWSYVFSYQVI